MKSKIPLTLILFLLFSCSSFKKNDDSQVSESTNIYEQNIHNDFELFDKANKALINEDFELALENLDKIEILFPNSSYAAKSRLMSAYIFFLKSDYEKTKAIAENFIKYYPSNKNIAYAHYLIGMTEYVLIKKPGFDQANAIKAKDKFLFINNAFPNNDYEQDILLKVNIIDNSIANHLIIIGKFYEREKNYIAALNYYIDIFDNYQKTQSIEEAIYLITRIYQKINEEELAIRYASILGFNYPQSKWYKKTYNLVKGIKEDINKDKKWYNKFNPIKLLKKEKVEKEKKWFELKKPGFSLF